MNKEKNQPEGEIYHTVPRLIQKLLNLLHLNLCKMFQQLPSLNPVNLSVIFTILGFIYTYSKIICDNEMVTVPCSLAQDHNLCILCVLKGPEHTLV